MLKSIFIVKLFKKIYVKIKFIKPLIKIFKLLQNKIYLFDVRFLTNVLLSLENKLSFYIDIIDIVKNLYKN